MHLRLDCIVTAKELARLRRRQRRPGFTRLWRRRRRPGLAAWCVHETMNSACESHYRAGGRDRRAIEGKCVAAMRGGSSRRRKVGPESRACGMNSIRQVSRMRADPKRRAAHTPLAKKTPADKTQDGKMDAKEDGRRGAPQTDDVGDQPVAQSLTAGGPCGSSAPIRQSTAPAGRRDARNSARDSKTYGLTRSGCVDPVRLARVIGGLRRVAVCFPVVERTDPGHSAGRSTRVRNGRGLPIW